MRLWIVNHYAKTSDSAGGSRHVSLARELAAQGHEVTIIASSYDAKTGVNKLDASDSVWSRQCLSERLSFIWIRVPSYSGNDTTRVKNMLAFAWRVLRRTGLQDLPSPDAVLGSSPHLLAAAAAERLAHRYKAAFLFEVRDLWPETLVALGGMSSSHPAIIGMSFLERRLYQRARKVITLLPQSIEYIARRGASPSKIHWIPNGIALDQAGEPAPPKGESDSFTIMYAGAHGRANGLDTVLQSAKYMETINPRVKYRLVGDGPEKPKLMQQAKDMGLRNVAFEPAVPKTQIFDVLRQADAFIMPLRDSPVFKWGVSPNKLFDYMAVGRPIVYAINAPNDPVAEARAGVSIRADDPRAMAEAIDKLARLSMPERVEMGFRAREYVEEHHDIKRLAKTLEAIVLEAIRGV